MADALSLLEQIQSLPPERIAEVEDFVAFIIAREHDRALSRAVTHAIARFSPESGTTQKTTPTMPFEFGDVVSWIADWTLS